MMMRGAVVAALLAVPGVALAQNTLTLVMGGEAYDGPPRFEVLFDGEKIGEGTVNAAIDTAAVGRFADAVVKSPYIESFEFDIPDNRFKVGGEVRIRFLNEAYGGDGSNRDRNLYVASVAINGLEVPATAMTTLSASGLEPNAILGDFLVIFDGTADGVAAAPDMGWPNAGAVEVATAEPEPAPVPEPMAEPEPADASEPAAVPQPAAEEPDALETADAPAVDAVDPAADAEALVETAVAPAEPVETVTPEVTAAPDVAAVPAPEPAPVTEPEPVAVAATEEDAALSRCELDNLYNVLGFNENSNDLTPRVIERLDQIIEDIGDNVCTLSLTGYSSTQGDFDTNALFAIERAQNVLRYLRNSELDYSSASAVGAGETDQFGPAFSDNRRVVITVTP